MDELPTVCVIGAGVSAIFSTSGSVRDELVRQGADQSLVLSVELLQRSVAIRLEGYDIELVTLFLFWV